MKFAIVDDHPLFRLGLTSGLREMFGPDVAVTEADCWGDALRKVDALRAADVVFCDLEMPDRKPVDGITALVKAAAPTPVLVVSASDRPGDVRMALGAGARGYVVKQKTLRVLRSAVEIVLAGDVYAPADLLMVPSVDIPDERPALAAHELPGRALSERQREILDLLAQGMSNKEIAQRLDIVEGTVKVQLKAIYRKIGVVNRTQAALYVRSNDLAETAA